MIYKIENNIKDIKNLLISLKYKYGNYAFLSYIDGEYGIRTRVYNSLCYEFYKKCKENNKTVIGICFKGTKSFLKNVCDVVIEIQDIAFNVTREKIIDTSQYSSNHKNDAFVPDNFYEGNDGWKLEYIRGLQCNEYENILTEINFDSLFYTLHCDGSRYINKFGFAYVSDKFIPYKINNENKTFDSIQNWINNNLFIKDKVYNNYCNNAIALWIRNTNKWPSRNMLPDCYNSIFKYCIDNNKTCYVFQDLLPVEIPNNKYIIDSTKRFKQRPDFDNFLNICDNCDIFIGVDSGSTEFILIHSTTNVYFTSLSDVGHILLKKRNNKNDSILSLNN